MENLRKERERKERELSADLKRILEPVPDACVDRIVDLGRETDRENLERPKNIVSGLILGEEGWVNKMRSASMPHNFAETIKNALLTKKKGTWVKLQVKTRTARNPTIQHVQTMLGCAACVTALRAAALRAFGDVISSPSGFELDVKVKFRNIIQVEHEETRLHKGEHVQVKVQDGWDVVFEYSVRNAPVE